MHETFFNLQYRGPLKGLSLQNFLNFSQTCISHHGCEKFQISGVKIIGRYIFVYVPKQTSPRQKEMTHFLQTGFSEDLFFTQQKGGRIMELKKWQS